MSEIKRKGAVLVQEEDQVITKASSWQPPPDIVPEDTKPKKATNDEIIDRQNKVFQLRLRGLTFDSISEIMNISVSTVKRDYDAARKEAKAELTEFDKEGFLGDTVKSLDDVIARAWEEYKTAMAGTPQRLKALDLIRVLEHDKFQIMADVGLVRRAAEQTELLVKHEIIKDWTPELREKAAKAYLNATLSTNLLEPAPDTNLDENVIDVTVNEDEKKDLE